MSSGIVMSPSCDQRRPTATRRGDLTGGVRTEKLPLSGATLTLTPRKVHILGGDHVPGDPIAELVLGQINGDDLVRTLPALPTGVAYRVLAQVAGRQTTFPLQKLPAGLTYDRVEVLARALTIHLSGRDVTLSRGRLTGGGC
jgi:hypothetical protein